ncbi:maltokinase N-terminal cap-like domain-containing protein [Nonomuraea fuscirosea]|uniref:maltokinase N-terminal cap-like domain-containing protein n=1 Tax=Nonomuraea fuscirosea TaxID=1291556 RepID=UPI0034194D1D
MAVIHHTTLTPTKLELLTTWLPTRPWYRGGPAGPELAKGGGFRLDDPEGAVGIEFMVVNDISGGRATAYLVPLTYRGAPLDEAGHALIGTAEHGVLGRRWIYDGCHDPVLIAELTALIEGRVQPQDQNTTDAPAPHVTRSYTVTSAATQARRTTAETPASGTTAHAPASSTTTEASASGTTTQASLSGTTDDAEGTILPGPPGTTLRLHRVLHAAAPLPPKATGHIAGVWSKPDGTQAHGMFLTVHPHD